MGFYNCSAWRKLRYEAIKKMGTTCMMCFAVNRPIHVDHIKPISKYPELSLKMSNLQILCEDCNLGKSNIHEDDFRERFIIIEPFLNNKKNKGKYFQRKEFPNNYNNSKVNFQDIVYTTNSKKAHVVIRGYSLCKKTKEYHTSESLNGKSVCKKCIRLFNKPKFIKKHKM